MREFVGHTSTTPIVMLDGDGDRTVMMMEEVRIVPESALEFHHHRIVVESVSDEFADLADMKCSFFP